MSSSSSDSTSPLAEISQAPGAFEQFLERNQKLVAAMAVLIALGAVAFVVLRGIHESKQTAAAHALFKADDIAALQQVAAAHAGSPAAASAMLLLAERQWQDGQRDQSVETLRNFVSGHPTHPAIGTAKASLGSKLMATGANDAAADLFRALAEDPAQSFIAPFAWISLGDIALEGGDKVKARECYTQAKAEEQVVSGFAQAATDRIAMLDADAPIPTDPPAPPSAKETPAPPDSANAEAAPAAVPSSATQTPAQAPAPEPSR
jgi:predicted negative regulator of RcsB-dependent stress response